MKKQFIILLAFLLLLPACSKKDTRISLTQLSDDYSLEDAKADNCVVFEDSDITSGQPVWDDFITATKKDKTATVRLAYYYSLGDSSHYSKELYEELKKKYPVLFIKDLSFDGKSYTLEGVEDGQLISKKYEYLMKYEGQPRSTTAIFSEYTYYVLVHDKSLTWEYIEDRMLSSQSDAFIDHFTVYSDMVMK